VNDYEARKAARIERYRARAAKANADANALYDRAHTMQDAIPFGQPLLVDHYSYRRDVNYRARIDRTYGRAFAEMDKRDHYEHRAAAAEANDAISSDDPDSVAKLDTKIAALEAQRDRVKAYNASCRKGTPDFSLLDEAQRADYAGLVRIGWAKPEGSQFPAYHLTNMGANVRRLKERRDYLAAQHERAAANPAGRETTIGDVRIVEDLEENRTRLFFPGKPSPDTIRALKARGFRWSPTNQAWQRQASPQAWYLAEQIATTTA